MSGFEVPCVIAGFVAGLLLRRGREEEAKLLGIAIGRRQGRGSRLQIEYGLPPRSRARDDQGVRRDRALPWSW